MGPRARAMEAEMDEEKDRVVYASPSLINAS